MVGTCSRWLLGWIGDAGRSAETATGCLAALLMRQPTWLNPQGFGGLRWDGALHTTISFLTNTDQQHLLSEQSLGSLAQQRAMQSLLIIPESGQ